MDIEGLPQKRKSPQDFAWVWRRAIELGIDAAGLSGPLVAAEIAKVEQAQKVKGGDTNKVQGKGQGQSESNPGAPAQVVLADLDIKHLKQIAEFLDVPLTDARKKDLIVETITNSEAWKIADQAAIVKATAAG